MDPVDAELDRLAEATFGQMPASGYTGSDAEPGGGLEGLFREAGLCAEDAHEAAVGLAKGIYLDFAEAAQATNLFSPRHSPRYDSYKAELIGERLRRRSGGQIVAERRTATQTRPQVLESGRGTLTGYGTLSVVLIDAGQGSSGYYPASTLEEAARSGVFGQGLHMYLDHPTASEEYERPERSVRDLAGVLASPARYDASDQSLKATATVFPDFRDQVTEMAPYIGLSIRGEAKTSRSPQGVVVEEITRALSVDFVTAAGRGGRIL